MDINRRRFAGLAMAGLTAGWPRLALAADTPPTPAEESGPFYPRIGLGENVADLTRVAGQSQRALGQKIELSGRVLTPQGEPVGLAMVLLWQANAAGRYDHPRNYHDAPADPGFRGHALIRTAADGSFRLTSVKPGSYPDGMGAGGWRTPHIHFEVIGEESRLLTQMYFDGETRNDADMLINAMRRDGRDAQALIAKRSGSPVEPDSEAYSWTIVLASR